tara:strand:+ start:6733 stop:7461 length:729 start_codon:yes stop_codon:yes gene_type:complete
MINLKDITKKFSDKVILDKINLNINEGDCLAIIGQSGVGKSVLLKHINGLLKPDSGKVLIDEVNINKINFFNRQKFLKKMSMVFQFGALFDSLSIENNILLALDHSTTLNHKNKLSKVKEVLDLVNLKNVENLFPADLSGGMRKRVGIARAIATNPQYILYDEPTTGLDPITTDKVCNLIGNISIQKKQTTIIVTHEMKIVHEIVNKVVMIYEGNIIFEGSPDELKLSKDKYIKYFISGKKY